MANILLPQAVPLPAGQAALSHRSEPASIPLTSVHPVLSWGWHSAADLVTLFLTCLIVMFFF